MTKAVAFWDFDKTITTKDTTLYFLFYTQSWSKIFLGGIRLGFYLLGMKLGILNTTKVKAKVYGYFFGGWELDKVNLLGEGFAKEIIPKLLNAEALEKLEWHKNQGHEIVVVSASPEFYLKPWCKQMGYDCIGTLLYSEGGLMGKSIISDCAGKEKVNRIKQNINLAEYQEIYAYGNSESGDRPMLNLANEGKTFFNKYN
ncbi:MAG: HAD-IB family hydrolase [Bacteroidia bacterium]